MAIQHLPATQAQDLFLHDRGYASYRGLATGVQHQRHFVVPGAAGAFQPARRLLKRLGDDSQVVSLIPSGSQTTGKYSVGVT